MSVSNIEEILDGIGQSVGAVAEALTMPPPSYTDPDFYRFEQEAIFRRTWLYLCHQSEIPHAGDYLTVTVGDDPLMVVRDHDATIRTMSAVCQHRGYVLAEDTGNTRYLRCPYHYWTYGLDGRLLSAPNMTPAHDLDHLKATICLPQVRTEVWHGLVFANLDPDAEALAPALADLDLEVGPYRIEDLVAVHTVRFGDLPFNWKNMQENALEEYHTTYIHKGYHENAPADRVYHHPYAPGDGAVYRHTGLIIKGGAPVPGRPTFPIPAGIPEPFLHFILFAAVPPAMFAAVRAEGIKMFRILPDGPDRTVLTMTFLYPPSTVERPEFPELLQRQIDLIDVIDLPDLTSNARVYRGLRSGRAARAPYSPQESTLPDFNQWLLERYLSYWSWSQPAPKDPQ